MLQVTQKVRLVEYIPSSQMDAKGKPVKDAAVFIYRGIKRREYLRINELLKTDIDGNVKMSDIELGYELTALALESVKNVQVESDKDGSILPLVIEHGEDGNVLPEILDLFSPRDLAEVGLEIIRAANPTEEQGEK